MYKNNLLVLLLISGLLFFAEKSEAQTLDKTLNGLSEKAAVAYVQPAISAFGSNLNSGWFSGSPGNKFLGLDFSLKIFAAGSFFNDANRNFSVSAPYRFTSPEVDEILKNSGFTPSLPGYAELKNEMLQQAFRVIIYGPTIVGSADEHMKIKFEGAVINNQAVASTTIDVDEVTGLLDNIPILPTPGIQLNLGTVYGTQVALRWLPKINLEDIGDLSLFGFGVLHNINSWIPVPLPLDFSLGFFTQKLMVSDVFESKATQFGAYVSQQIGIGVSVTPYVGITYETSSTNVTYNYTYDTPAGDITEKIKFDLESENKMGLTLGAKFSLFFFNIAADYKIAKTKTATVAMFYEF